MDVKTKKELKEDLTNQIKPASCLIILACMYASYSDWIKYGVNELARMEKYTIGVEQWRQEKVPRIVSNNADVMIGWNSDYVINAIKNVK